MMTRSDHRGASGRRRGDHRRRSQPDVVDAINAETGATIDADDEVVAAEMPAGAAVLYLGTVDVRHPYELLASGEL